MAQKTKSRGPAAPVRESGPSTRPSEVEDLLGKVNNLLQEDRTREALDLLVRAKVTSAWVTNAVGVCELRLGSAESAVATFRNLVLSGGLFLRDDVPTVCKANYAVALLAAGNLAGGLVVLDEISDEENPAVLRLRAAVERWRRGLTLWEKFGWWFGTLPGRKPVLDSPLGDLE
jgi:hypothetical protein